MVKYFKKAGILLFAVSVLSAAVLNAEGPKKPGDRGRGRTYSVAEPAAIALLGAGIVSLGLYAKRKKKKKD